MTDRHRLSICYAVPGHNLLSSAGPTRNVLSLAGALSNWARVTVAFRRVLEPITPCGFKVIEVKPDSSQRPHCVDDAAVRGVGYSDFFSYLASIRRFIATELPSYDMVLEKSWLLSGYISSHCRRRGIPAALVENIVPMLGGAPKSPSELLRYARLWAARFITGRYIRNTPRIIAETEQLKKALVRHWRIPASRVRVVGLGVDRHRFHPMEQTKARSVLGIPQDVKVLLYAGGLDRTHDLTPVLEAMTAYPDPSLQLHIVGDGMLREAYESRRCACRDRLFFHGRVPYEKIPEYVAAADLCLAPYDPAAFPGGEVAYSSLKIPEYLAAARPVVSVPSGHILNLIKPGVSGFLFPNQPGHWLEFLQRLPPRAILKQMGERALRTTAFRSWEDTACDYFSICEEEILRIPKKESILSP